MVEEFSPGEGHWWRFDRYEVEDGYIRPAPDAHLDRYNPWKHFPAQSRGRVDASSLYLSLCNLDATLQPHIESWAWGTLTSHGEVILCDWCRANGLLGILLQEAHSVSLAPRWGPLQIPGMGTESELYPTQVRFIRTGSGWDSVISSSMHDDYVRLVDEPEQSGELVRAEHIPPKLTSPGVIRRDIQSGTNPGDWQAESLDQTWATYFPDVPAEERENYQYPLPLSDAFWRQYAEPVNRFLGMARTLATVVETLREMPPPDQLSSGMAGQVYRAQEQLHSLLSSAQPTLAIRNDGIFEQRWTTTSLLASYAMMFLFDLTDTTGAIRRCQACRNLYISYSSRARYCSKTCRHRAQKRNQRAQERQE